jgi:D-xylose transport system substrate-binding protein
VSSKLGRVRVLLALVAALATAVVISACGTTNNDEGSDSGSGDTGSADSGTVGLLLPESKTSRYEQFDHPLFEAALKKGCPDCTLDYANADQDAAQQQSQAESMLTKGVDVLVLDPVDGKAAQAIVNKAKSQDVPVVSYDRLASGPVDYYVSFGNQRVGQLQGQALLKAISASGNDPKDGSIVMINGSPTDPNAAQFKEGAHSVLDGKVDIAKEYDTPDWSPDKAQTEMQQALTASDSDPIGVYSANDGMAAGIVAAMKSADLNPLPPLTGQDAQIDGIQRVVDGDQAMTVYKAIGPEAQAAADMAISLIKGEDYADATDKVDNGTLDVPSQLLTPVAVTKDNVKDTVIKDGFYTVGDICTKQYASACKAAGLQ